LSAWLWATEQSGQRWETAGKTATNGVSETLTIEVKPSDDACVSVQFNQQYDLVVAALALGSRNAGEACFPIASVLSELRMEDRDIDGIVYVTPSIGFDLFVDGGKVGKVVVSFETKQPPPAAQKANSGDSGPWCGTSAWPLVNLEGLSAQTPRVFGLFAEAQQTENDENQPPQTPGGFKEIDVGLPVDAQHVGWKEMRQQLHGDHRDFLPPPPPPPVPPRNAPRKGLSSR